MQNFWLEIINLGIDRYTILLILALPIVATIVGIAKHFIGIKTLSMYAPIVLTYAFLELGFDKELDMIRYWDGLRYGLFLFAIVFVTTIVFYYQTKTWRLHFYPKLSLIFTAVSIAMLFTIILAAYLGSSGFININIFSVVLISAVSERMVSMYSKTNLKSTSWTTLETLILTLVCYSLISWTAFQDFIFSQPWFILAIVIINIVVGKYTDLRLSELWRFRDILDKDYGENGTKKNTKK